MKAKTKNKKEENLITLKRIIIIATMSSSVRAALGVCLGVLLIMKMMSPASALTIHPAVLKNFVGPYRKPGDPILQSTWFERPRMMGERFVDRNAHGANFISGGQPPYAIFTRQGMENAASKENGQELVYPAAAFKGPASPEEWNRSLR
ncbi:hypothetical protein SK128_014339 [Halocaridina rubra]|uniref:Uncharacterized protein n=1 Tax=Halocaridina rubra TaxID=373956 RepID=A0AAN8WTK9_HALRR